AAAGLPAVGRSQILQSFHKSRRMPLLSRRIAHSGAARILTRRLFHDRVIVVSLCLSHSREVLSRSMRMIQFEHVSKVYETQNDENVALEDINIQIEEGEFVFVLGHSGAGKSTFLKLMLMEEKPTEGRVIINGQDLTRLRRRKVPYIQIGRAH